jgi:heterodisulfide reductase subunit B2
MGSEGERPMSYLFFPGCSLDSTAGDYQLSTTAVARSLGLQLPELPDWTCCGSTPAHQENELLSLALPARNLQAAAGSTLAVCCAACFNRLKTANHKLKNSARARTAVREVLGSAYDGSTPVKHLLDILVHDVGLKKVSERVCKPLKGLKVAAYYGCLLVRPPAVTEFDDPENPRMLDDLIAAAGAEMVEWPHKTECCGAGYSVTDAAIVRELSREILAMARDAGADCIATACGMCQLNLDLRQGDIEKESGEKFGLPVFYFTQLLGLAFGLTPGELGLRRLVVSPDKLLAAKGLAAGGAAKPEAPAERGMNP